MIGKRYRRLFHLLSRSIRPSSEVGFRPVPIPAIMSTYVSSHKELRQSSLHSDKWGVYIYLYFYALRAFLFLIAFGQDAHKSSCNNLTNSRVTNHAIFEFSTSSTSRNTWILESTIFNEQRFYNLLQSHLHHFRYLLQWENK